MLLSGAALSSQNLPDSSPNSTASAPNRVYAPDHVFIGEVLVASGDMVKAEQAVLRLDTLDLTSELARYQCELDLENISAQRLDDNYLNRFVLCVQSAADQSCPLNKLLEMRRQAADASVNEGYNVQTYYEAGTKSETDVLQANARTEKRVAAVEQTLDDIDKTTTKIRERRALNEAKIARYRKQIDVVQRQIELCTILAPGNGRVTVPVVPGIFVEKGDLLFEIA